MVDFLTKCNFFRSHCLSDYMKSLYMTVLLRNLVHFQAKNVVFYCKWVFGFICKFFGNKLKLGRCFDDEQDHYRPAKN